MEQIGKVSLHNGGGFVCKIEFEYIKDDGTRVTSKTGGDLLLGQTQTVDPASLGVPSGVTIWLKANVVAGKDNTATQGFAYVSENPSVANYTITGTIWDNTMGLINVTSDESVAAS